MNESCEIYITGVSYKDSSWEDNPDNLLQLIYDNFAEISGFYFVNMALSMAQVYNVMLNQPNYDSMVLYLKGVKYKHNEFLSLENTKEMEGKLKEQLDYIDGVGFDAIEVRSVKKYSDIDLGLLEFKKRIV